jgi:geranylgeranyl diphosphate synthase type I
MNDDKLAQDMLSAVDMELRACVKLFFQNKPEDFQGIIDYQMGWEGERMSGKTAGKRLRPLFTLSACHALGGDWHKAVPAAAAIELVHNFSLVHDDIQDHSETRRGRPTIWVKWSEAQAINTGDALLATAFLEIQRLDIEEKLILLTLSKLNAATLNLTTGQYLDLAFEQAENISLSAYWQMVRGKTGALFEASFALAAIIAGRNMTEIDKFEAYGSLLGAAFQVQDDYLGIFGENHQTGKSVASDLMERKKTYPIIYALEHLPEFRQYWVTHKPFSAEDVFLMKELLISNGIAEVTLLRARSMYDELIRDYPQLFGRSENSRLLGSMVNDLFDRKA